MTSFHRLSRVRYLFKSSRAVKEHFCGFELRITFWRVEIQRKKILETLGQIVRARKNMSHDWFFHQIWTFLNKKLAYRSSPWYSSYFSCTVPKTFSVIFELCVGVTPPTSGFEVQDVLFTFFSKKFHTYKVISSSQMYIQF